MTNDERTRQTMNHHRTTPISRPTIPRIRFGLTASLLLMLLATSLHAADPVISNYSVRQRAGTKLVDIRYDVADADGDKVNVAVNISTNAGLTYDVPVTALTGDCGSQIVTGANKHIVWNGAADFDGKYAAAALVRLRVDDAAVSPAPPGMVLIPAGSFQMGDSFTEGNSDERPVHSVEIGAFLMDKYEVTKALWDEVATWAAANGYDISAAGGSGKATNHPVQQVTWYKCVKWCNARSEKEGRTPAYYTSAEKTTVYRMGNVNVQNDWVRWDTGYRLPTEAEWEKAARGGVAGKRFPWSDADTISHSRANYYAVGGEAYDLSNGLGFHGTYDTGGQPYTSPVGSFAGNGYGLYDMAGNVWEWCWDWHGGSYYGSSPGVDPRGASSGSYRVARGGSWGYYARYCRVAYRYYTEPGYASYGIGFRAVLPPGQQ